MLSRLLLGLSLLAPLSCSDSNDTPASGPSSSTQQIGCASDPRVTPFASGLSAKSATGKFSVELVTASPSPPTRGAGDSGVNLWTVKVLQGGAQLPAEAKVTITTLMPDHGHGSPKVPLVTPNGDGTYAVTNLYLFMAGVWEISFLVNAEDPTKLSICVP